jgi:hypothetical protein
MDRRRVAVIPGENALPEAMPAALELLRAPTAARG